MLILQSLLVIAQGVIAVAMIALILLQHGRGADAGTSFGSGSSATVFGSRGPANFLSRSTAVLAALFVINCLSLAYLAREQAEAGGIMQGLEEAQQQEQPQELPGGSADPSIPAPPDAGPAIELPAIPGAAEPVGAGDADAPPAAELSGEPAGAEPQERVTDDAGAQPAEDGR